MEAKLCLVVMLIILGGLTVQGAIPRNNKKKPLKCFQGYLACEYFFKPYMSTVFKICLKLRSWTWQLER